MRWLKNFRIDVYFRVRTMLYVFLSVNVVFAVFMLVCAVFRESFWEGALAFYHLTLCALYAYLTCRLTACGSGAGHLRELRASQTAGFLLAVLDLALGGIMFQVIRMGRSYIYPGYLIYAMAVFAFCSLGFSIYNAAAYRKFHNPVLSAVGEVNLAVSLMSIFALETALVTTFGSSVFFRQFITSATALIICAAVLVSAGVIARKRKRGPTIRICYTQC